MTPEKDVNAKGSDQQQVADDSEQLMTDKESTDGDPGTAPGTASVTDGTEDAAAAVSTGAVSTAAADSASVDPQAADFTSINDPLGFGTQRMPDENEAALDSSDLTVEAMQEKLHDAESKVTQHWEQLLRLQADMENQRKRAQKDVANARKFALEAMANDLLPVRDSLEMGLIAAEAEDADLNKIVEGSDLTLKMLTQLFEKYNINELNPVDEKFDPEYHQAMTMQEVEGTAANTVTTVFQKGYTLNDRLIRPALVVVAK